MYSNLQYHSMLKGYCDNVSLIKTPLKYGISSSRAYVDNSMFVNGLSGILTLNMCIVRLLDGKWMNILPFHPI